jgi:hypothetical protein
MGEKNVNAVACTNFSFIVLYGKKQFPYNSTYASFVPNNNNDTGPCK